mmetsp:Transcript_9333/g.14066  ORF Transcript_9333/g.14066 Transcript_9333/m.14066 type:complete len:892 (+) Transcript_9333:226-2901(+)
MLDYKEFGRSGTAPNRNGKAPPGNRVRPKTRGVVTGSSELADLNMSLKMEKRNVTTNYDSSDDPADDFQSAIENWERSRRMKQTQADQQASKPKSAYTRGDPVSAAYSSQFKPIKTGSPKSSPRTMSTKARAVAELHAAYGMPIGNDARASATSSTKRTTSSTFTSRKKPSSAVRRNDGKDKPSNSPTLSTGSANDAMGTSSRKTRPISAKDNSTVSSSGSSAAHRTHRKNLTVCTSNDGAASTARHGTHSARAGGGGSSRTQEPKPPAERPYTSSTSVTESHQSAGRDTSPKGGYKRRPEHLRVSSAGGKGMETVAAVVRPNSVSISSGGCAGSASSSACQPSAPVVQEDAAVTTVRRPSPNIDTEMAYDETSREGRATSFSHKDSTESQRPQSRKLYLGSGGTSSGPDSDALSGSALRAPRSAGAMPRHRLSPESHRTDTAESPQGDPTLSAAASFGGFAKPSNPWHGTVVNYDERPPSRQRSAFPIHLADMESALRRGSARNGERKTAFCESTDTSDKAASIAVPAAPPTGSPRAIKLSSGTLESPLGRPPSRQRIAAQNLWGDETELDADLSQAIGVVASENTSSEEGPTADAGTGLVSPLLTPYASSISIGGVVLADDDGPCGTSPSPNQIAGQHQPPSRSDRARSAFDSCAPLGPMYDPAADGFSQLDSRSHTAPFKIRLNQSSRKNSGTSRIGGDCGEFPFKSSAATRAKYEAGGRSRRDVASPVPTAYLQIDRDRVSPNLQVHHHSSSSHDDGGSSGCPRSMGSSKSTPTLTSPGKYAKSAGGMTMSDFSDGIGMTRSMSSDNMAAPGEASPVSRIRKTPQDYVDDMSFLDEELTVMTMYSDEGDKDACPDADGVTGLNASQSLMLESSLGEDFLNLFAQGGR